MSAELDSIDYAILALYWPPEVWLSRVGTNAERNDWRERTPDGGPRGVLTAGGVSTQVNEVCGG